MGVKIPISFKETEMDIYNYIKSKRNASVYIKDLVEAEMKKTGAISIETTVIYENKSENDLGIDF